MRDRLGPLIDGLATEAPGRCSVLVGHGSLYRAVLPLLLTGLGHSFTADHALGYTDIVIAEHHSAGFVCTRWAGMPISGVPASSSDGLPDHQVDNPGGGS